MPTLLRAAALWPRLVSVALASTYEGDTVPASDGKGHFTVVRHADTGKIVWASNKKQGKDKAKKKADKAAGKMNEDSGVIDDCNGPSHARPEWCV